MKYSILFLVIVLSSVAFVSANPYSFNLYEAPTGVTNGSLLDVNNSQYFQGYTPTTLRDFFKLTYDALYCAIGDCGGTTYNITDGTADGQMTFWNGTSWTPTETSELFWDDTDKRLGIGTASPENKLDVSGAQVIGSSYAGVNTAPTDGLLVEGNVGIGTDSPINKVEIVQAGGTARAFGGQIFSVRGLSPASYGYQLALSFSTTLDHRATVIGAGIYSQIRALGGSTVPKAAGIYIDTPVKEGGTGAFTTAYGLYINTQDKATNNYGVYVKGSQDSYFEGNVGIGTDSPQNKLDVEGGAVIGSSYAGVNTAPTDGLLVEGNVVLGGTTSDGSKLKVIGSINQTEVNAIINNIYGGMWYHNHTATELNFAVDGTYYNLFMTNMTHNNGFTYQGGFNQTSNLTAQYSGLYQITYMASGDGQNNHEYFTTIFIDETIKPNCENHHKMAAGGDIITQSGNCFLDIVAGEVVSLRAANVGNTGTGNYYSSNINLVRIGN